MTENTTTTRAPAMASFCGPAAGCSCRKVLHAAAAVFAEEGFAGEFTGRHHRRESRGQQGDGLLPRRRQVCLYRSPSPSPRPWTEPGRPWTPRSRSRDRPRSGHAPSSRPWPGWPGAPRCCPPSSCGSLPVVAATCPTRSFGASAAFFASSGRCWRKGTPMAASVSRTQPSPTSPSPAACCSCRRAGRS